MRAIVSGEVFSPPMTSTRGQKVDRVEGVADDEALGALHSCRKTRRQEARGRRGDDRLGRGSGVDLRQQSLFQLFPLRRVLLNEAGAGNAIRHGGAIREAALRGAGSKSGALQGRPGVGDGGAELGFALRIGIVGADIEPFRKSACSPAGADHAGADDRHGGDGIRGGFDCHWSVDPRCA